MSRTIRYRLHPQMQEKTMRLYQVSGACQYVWNHFVAKLRDEYECYDKSDYRYFTISKQFTLLRRHQVKWLQEYSANIVKASLKPIQETYQVFFKGSKRRAKAKIRLAKTHKKIVQARTNWCHQVSREIADKYDVVYLGDIKIQG